MMYLNKFQIHESVDYCVIVLHCVFGFCFFVDLSQRVDSVKEENLKLKSENQVLGQYIENLMAASSVFQSTSPKAKKKYDHYFVLHESRQLFFSIFNSSTNLY